MLLKRKIFINCSAKSSIESFTVVYGLNEASSLNLIGITHGTHVSFANISNKEKDK